MSKSEKYRLWKGRKVAIYSADKKYLLGFGKYEGSKRFWFGSLGKHWTPKFRLKTDNKLIYGFECWWTPITFSPKPKEV